MTIKQTPHFNQGAEHIKVGFILSAPGRYEEEAGRPAVKVTGKNLDSIISKLHFILPELFPYTDRYEYRITNADNEVHYKSKTNNTEGNDSKILNANNIDRVLKEVDGLTDIISLGSKAALLKSKLIEYGFRGNIYCDIHLGLQSINSQISRDREGNILKAGESGNTEKRIAVIASRLIEQINKKKPGS